MKDDIEAAWVEEVSRDQLALDIKELRKAFGPTQALKDVSLTLRAGEVRALLGENGSGKSTLIKILAGFHSPDAGSIEVLGVPVEPGSAAAAADAGLRFVHQDLGLIESLTVEENLNLVDGFHRRLGGLDLKAAARAARNELAAVGLEVDPNTLISRLSPAERTGVALARALRDATGAVKVLVLDEPTANLPTDEVSRLISMVRATSASGVAVIYVTHRLEEVQQVADSVTILRDGREIHSAPAEALDHDTILKHMLGDAYEVEFQAPPPAAVQAARPPVLVADNVWAARLEGLSFDLRPQEIVGIAGVTGSGREQVAGVLFGALSRAGGDVRVDGSSLPPGRPDVAMAHGLGFVPASRVRDGVHLDLSAIENVSLGHQRQFWRWPSLRLKAERRNAARWFHELNVRPEHGLDLMVSSFSGGNQQKIVFAKWLQREPQIFLLEEPTQGVDVGTKAMLHQRLREVAEAGAAVLISSSDNEELAAVCSRVLVLSEGTVAAELKGNEVTAGNIVMRSAQGRNRKAGVR